MSPLPNLRIIYITIGLFITLFAYIYQNSWFESTSSRVIVQDKHRNISYVGKTGSGVEKFLNIFYAEDTSGARRFSPPVPVTPVPGLVIDATSIGAVCPQGTGPAPLPFASPITNISENCLSLSITRPVGANVSAKLPVMVWLHGGGFTLGTGNDQLYQPDGLVKLSVANQQPVIFVAINYRIASG